MTDSEERVHADALLLARVEELEAWEQSKVFSPVKIGAQAEDLVDTPWALTWKEVDGVKTAKARLVAKGFQDPDLREESVDIAGCVSRRSSHLLLISLGSLKKWPVRSLDIRSALLQAAVFDREVHLRAPCGKNFQEARRV